MSRGWAYRSVAVDVGDDGGAGALASLGVNGWEAYAAVPLHFEGPAIYDTTKVLVLLKRRLPIRP